MEDVARKSRIDSISRVLRPATMKEIALAATLNALRDNGWNRVRAAKQLSISKRTLYDRIEEIKQIGISIEESCRKSLSERELQRRKKLAVAAYKRSKSFKRKRLKIKKKRQLEAVEQLYGCAKAN